MNGENAWKKVMIAGITLLLCFVLWTVLIQKVDVQPAGDYEPQKNVGFATINTRFHDLTGVNMTLYELTDIIEWLAIAVCAGFGALGLIQLIRGKSLKKVDPDILLLGIYYMIVIAAFLLFEKIAVNYRPILIEGKAEASYPSSTALLVLSVMPTLIFQVNRRMPETILRKVIVVLSVLFAAFVAAARLISGVHWLTDIIGAVILSAGLYMVYRAAVMKTDLQK